MLNALEATLYIVNLSLHLKLNETACPYYITHTLQVQSPDYSAMEHLKRILPRRSHDLPGPETRDDPIPHLIRKKKAKKSKKEVLPIPKPIVIGFVLETFSNPALPTIVVRPPTPPANLVSVEERLFERSGAVFILRKEETFARGPQSRSLVSQQLRVPAKRYAMQVCAELPEIDESSLQAEAEEDEDVSIDPESEADYRAYMTGMNAEI